MSDTALYAPIPRALRKRPVTRARPLVRRSWRRWVGLIGLSAFGPLFDIVTRLPVNWLIASAVLIFAAGVFVHELVRPSMRLRATPLLTIVILAWNYYYFAQVLHPGANHLNALMAFRVPLVGLAAYVGTLLLALRCRSRAGLEQALAKYVHVVLGVGSIVAVYALFQWLVGYDRLAAFHLLEPGGFYLVPNVIDGSAVFRPFGTMRRNEALAAFLVIVEIVALSAWRLPAVSKKWLYIGIPICLAGMFISLSLTGIAIFIIWLCMLAVMKLTWKSFRIAVVVFLLTVIGALAADRATNGLIRMRIYGHRLDVAQGVGRLEMFKNWIAEMRDRSLIPALFGTGICTGVDETSAERLNSILSAFGVQPEVVSCGWSHEVHDDWFATLSLEVGLIGLSLVWCFYGVAALYAIRSRRSVAPIRTFGFMAALGLVAFWPAGFVGALTLYHPVNVYFWSMAALVEADRVLPV
jgi:hypothetical protein